MLICLKTNLNDGTTIEAKIYEDNTTTSIIIKAIYLS
jgi:hypothetical protein